MVTRGLIALLVVTLLLALAGCNTFEGMGRDIQSLGEGIEEAAN
jgi:predicted small secreted protein